MDNDCVLVREMAEDPNFIPNRTDKILEGWAKKGLTKYSQLQITQETLMILYLANTNQNLNTSLSTCRSEAT